MSEKKKYYISKDDLWDEIKYYYKQTEKNPDFVMQNALGHMIKDIATNLMKARNFSGYPFVDEMRNDAMSRMVSTLCDKKFILRGDKTCRRIYKTLLKGYEFSGDYDLEYGKRLFIKNLESKKTVSVFGPTDEYRFEIENEQCWIPEKIVKGLSIVKSKDPEKVISFYTYEAEEKKVAGRIKYKSGIVNDMNGERITEKLNAFGYLTLISRNEAISRIKKENRAVSTLDQHREHEFSEFMSDNPNMAPQRIFDDTYEISQ